jgi:hypothetical protein
MRLWPTLGFFIVVPGALSLAWAQEPPKPPETQTTKPTETRRAPEAASQVSNPAPAAPTSPLLREGTAVKLRLLHTLNSKTAVLGDPLNFSVAEDVVVDGINVVKVGSPAIGRVRQAKPARTMGRGAELGLEMQYMKAGQIRVPLRGSQAREGESKTGETVALTVMFGLSGLVKHGSEIEVKEGSLFTAYVDQDTIVPAPPVPSGPGQTDK